MPSGEFSHIVLALVAAATAVAVAEPDLARLRDPSSVEWRHESPARFVVRLETTRGEIAIEVHRPWAPLGSDRFYNLTRHGYYDGARFFRVVAGRWAQFGIHGDPDIARIWRGQTLPDDPRRESNVRGAVAFAWAVQNGRSTQVFMNLTDNSSTLDAQGFAPFGRVVAGMQVADSLFAGYGEDAGGGIRGGRQEALFTGGDAYLSRNFPKLDYIRHAIVVGK